VKIPGRFSAWVLAMMMLASGWIAPGVSAGPPPRFEHWEPEIARFEQSDRTNPPPRGAILFTGSSTIRLWKNLATDYPGHTVINRGFGGCRTEDVTHFADRIVFPYAPRLIVLRGGANDVNDGKSPAEAAADFQTFVETVRRRLPETRIAFLSLNPSVARWSQADRQKETNLRIRNYIATQVGITFIDIDDLCLGSDGKPRADRFVADGLHFNAEGYRLLAERVRPYLGPADR
jgi:lysophospholipase L1-like esterase